MDRNLLLADVQRWIVGNTEAGLGKLAFAKNPFAEIDYKELLNQVQARAKAKQKLPTWFAAENILYPPKISIEQTSSEKTALYKSHLVSGDIIDLTGGFGVDSFYFSKRSRVVHCEANRELSEIAGHNFKMLGAAVECIAGDGSQILKALGRQFGCIYVDPSRRNHAKGKVFLLADCEPNVPELLDFYFGYSETVLLKAAPLLDLSAALNELHDVSEVHIVAVDNEVKELLFLMQKNSRENIQIKTVNLLKDRNQEFDFDISESQIACEFSAPQNYLYEANAAVYKSGAFNLIGRRFGLKKLHPHSHLYTSETLVEGFPGRTFRIEKTVAYEKAAMKATLEHAKSNVSVRNFPESVEKLRAKWKISDGGDTYSFFTTAHPNDKIVLLCAKI